MLPGMKKYDAESLNKELQNLRLELNKGSAKTFHELLEDLFVFLEFDNEDKVNKNFIKYIIKQYRAKIKGYINQADEDKKVKNENPKEYLLNQIKNLDPIEKEQIKRAVMGIYN